MIRCNHYILLFLLYLGAAQAAPTVSNVTVVTKWSSHSTVFITWDSTSANTARLRYGTTTAYEGSMYGGIQPAGFNGSATVGIQSLASGLRYSTLYHFCPQSSDDGGSTWSTCVDATYTTPALTSPHPALPVAATSFSVAMPNVAGTVAFTVTSCPGDLLTKWTAAETQRLATHVALVVPDSINCGVTNFYPPGAADAKYFTTANVNATTNIITYNSHGFSNGNTIIFGSDERLGSPPTGLQQSYNYYACNVTTNTFQVCSDVALTSVVALVTAGATGQCVYSPQTMSNNWLFIVPEWPLGTNWRVPEGVRYDSTAPWAGPAHGKIFLNTIGASQRLGLLQQCGHNQRFMNENTTGDTTELASTTTDPTPWGGLWQVAFSTANILFDRSWDHGKSFPNRLFHGIYVDGRQNGFINSQVDNMSYGLAYRKTSTDLIPTIMPGGTTTNISVGYYNLPGVAQCHAASTVSATVTGGTPTGLLLQYYDMGCTLQVVGPTGLSMSCTGCTYSTSASPDFPVNGSGNYAAGRIGAIGVSAGVLVSVISTYRTFEVSPTVYSSLGEGPTGILGPCAFGTGPTIISNNKIEAAGIAMHSDDSCTIQQYANPGSNLTVTRNTFTLRDSWNPLSGSFDNIMRLVRNLFEIKQGPVNTVTANKFSGQWSSVTPQGYGFVVFPTLLNRSTSEAQMTDVDFSNNSITNNAGGVQFAGSQPGAVGLPPSMLRTRLANNLIQVTPLYDPAIKDGSAVLGLGSFGWGGMEDVTRSHNTMIAAGNGTFMDYQVNSQREGDNDLNGIKVLADPLGRLGWGLELDYITPTNPMLPTPPATFGKDILDWVVTQGAGNPSYSWNPVLVPWTSANATNWNTGWGTSGATVECAGSCSTSTAAQRVAAVKFVNFAGGNYALDPTSPYHNAATDGTDMGANFTTLSAAQGAVGTPTVLVTGDTTATITTVTPDTFPCYVYVSNDGWVTYLPFAGSASTTQAVNLTGLLASTAYDGYVLCAVEQPHFTFTTTGAPLGVGIRNVTGRSIGIR